MQTLFLHLRKGDVTVRDAEGQDFETILAAKDAAAGSLREISAEQLIANQRLLIDSIEIRDAQDRLLATVNTDETILPLLPWRLQKA
ncbi:hypothetical protein ASG39_16460 [Rhizobium sp. Leaf371]|uniref:DUF6894 family protein n=1 Tax=Rhizobium sp. Leaf371 TaxID=1736355 RepID=UPI0007137A63|nr:hypothetical protein [Rhizobium sp. Leaf371]KQS63462.1 hypothetical protein ASG39_16460 [Rhizobium sp. Leaf371]